MPNCIGIIACCRITYYHWKIDTVAVIQLKPALLVCSMQISKCKILYYEIKT